MTGLLVVMSGELIFSPEPFIIIIMFSMSLICNDKASRDDCLITLNVMRERRELDRVSWWIVLPTYTLFLFVYVYA